MAQIMITLSPAQMQALNKARRDAGAPTVAEYLNAVVASQATDPSVIKKLGKKFGKEQQDAAAAAKAESDKNKEAFRKSQRKAKDKASK